MCGLLVGIFLSVRTCWFHNIVTSPSWLVSNDFGAWQYRCSLSYFTPISLHMLKCSWSHTLSYLFMHCSFASIRSAHTMCSTVSSNCLQSLHLLSVAICNIIVAWYWVCNAWSRAAVISLSVYPLRSPLDSHSKVSSPPISCPSILLIYWPCIPLFSHFFLKDSPNFALLWWMSSFLCCCLTGLIILHPLLLF